MTNSPRAVDDINYGVYIWRDGKGRIVADSDYNYMLIPARKGDAKKIRLLKEAAVSFGITDGHEEFLAGVRPISDSEFEEQKARQESGLVPDEYDLGNLIDEYNYERMLDKQ